MASKPPIRDSSITEPQLAPHLRKRIRTGSSYQYTVVDTSPGSSDEPATRNVIADYSAAAAVVINADPWCLAETKAALTTAVVSSEDVTDTDPWTLTPSFSADVTVTITGTVTRTHTATAVMLAIVAGTRDALVFCADGTFAVTGVMRLTAGVPVRIHARIYSAGDIPATATITDTTLTIRAL